MYIVYGFSLHENVETIRVKDNITSILCKTTYGGGGGKNTPKQRYNIGISKIDNLGGGRIHPNRGIISELVDRQPRGGGGENTPKQRYNIGISR